MKEEQFERKKTARDNLVLVIVTSCLGILVLIMGSIMGYYYYRKHHGKPSVGWVFNKKLPSVSLQSVYSNIHFPGSTVISTDSKLSFLERRGIHDLHNDRKVLLHHQIRDSYTTIGPESSVSQNGQTIKLNAEVQGLNDVVVRQNASSLMPFSPSQLQSPPCNYIPPMANSNERPFSYEHTPTDLVGTFIEIPCSSSDERTHDEFMKH
jgi:hypothetical protein